MRRGQGASRRSRGGWKWAWAFVLVLPSVWWAGQTLQSRLVWGWDDYPHRDRFYLVYMPGQVALRLASEVTGHRFGQGDAVILQDAAIALPASLLLAILLSGWSRWQARSRVRLMVAQVSLALPWFGAIGWGRPMPYAAAVSTLAVAYFGGVLVATAGPVGRGMRSALLAISFASGGVLYLWRPQPLEWFDSGSLLASFLLLLCLIVRSLRGEAETA